MQRDSTGRLEVDRIHEDDPVELYDLGVDLGEKNHLAMQQPERARELRQQLHAWREQTAAQTPVPNPDYDPKKSELWK